jgi:hypothetical protein
MARVFIDPIYQKKLSLFLRYQSAIERAANRALKELEQLQSSRREAEVWAPMRSNTQPPVRAEQPEVASFRSTDPPAIVPLPLEPYPWHDSGSSASASY